MIGWIAAAVIAVLGAFGIFVALKGRDLASAQSEALRKEMQSLLAAQSQATAAQINQLAQSMSSQLGQVTQQVQSGMASVGTIASGAQKAVSEQLQASTQMLGTIRQQLGEVQHAGDRAVLQRQHRFDESHRAGGGFGVAEVALDR